MRLAYPIGGAPEPPGFPSLRLTGIFMWKKSLTRLVLDYEIGF